VPYLGYFLAALLISLALTPLVRRLSLATGRVASPRADRWHTRQTALLGGIAIFLAFLAPALYYYLGSRSEQLLGLLLGSAAVFTVGLVDDLRGLSPRAKLAGQVAAALLLVSFGVEAGSLSHYPAIVLVIVWVVAITNSLNLLDNMDGLSAGVSAICAGALWAYGLTMHLPAVAANAAALAGAALGFLAYNFSPASIFMGDCGALLLGFSLAAIGVLIGQHYRNLPFTMAVPLLVLAAPIFDTCLVTVLRKLNHRPISQGGRDHTSHRLVLLGLSERRAVLFIYAISALFGLLALLYVHYDIIVVTVLATLAAVALALFGAFLAGTAVYGSEATAARGNGALRRWGRAALEVALDVVMIVVSYVAAYLLRFEGIIDATNRKLILQALPLMIGLRLAVFHYFHLYRRVWHLMGTRDSVDILKAASLSSLLAAFALLLLFRFQGYSRSVLILDWLLLTGLLLASRFSLKLFRETVGRARPERRVLIMGAGEAAHMLLREVRDNARLGLAPVGLLDDDPGKLGRLVRGIEVMGTRHDIPRLAREGHVQEVILAISSIAEEDVKDIAAICAGCGLSLSRLALSLQKPSPARGLSL
jgi:UDP-GlcNAc:undecaprenyl-phosphate GlcNAc-1-phosphate transferase